MFEGWDISDEDDRRYKRWIAALVLTALGLVVFTPQCGCINPSPTANQGDPTVTPTMTAGDIETAVQTAINSNASIVNDMWPVVAMVFIAMIGAVLLLWITHKQTNEIREHVDKCNGHS